MADDAAAMASQRLHVGRVLGDAAAQVANVALPPTALARIMDAVVWRQHMGAAFSADGTIVMEHSAPNWHAYIRRATMCAAELAQTERDGEHGAESPPVPLTEAFVQACVQETVVDDLLGTDEQATQARERRTCPVCKRETLRSKVDQRRAADEMGTALMECEDCGIVVQAVS